MAMVLPGSDDDPVAGGQAPLTAARLWQEALAQLQHQVSGPYFETFLRPTSGVRFDGSRLVVSVPDDFAGEWLSGRLRVPVNQVLRQLAGSAVEVDFAVP